MKFHAAGLVCREKIGSPVINFLNKLPVILADIKIQHTVFALPFAVMSTFLAAEGWPAWDVLAWICAAMLGARSAAMAFNRIVDARFDQSNPRTRGRALPSGEVSQNQYVVFLAASSAFFIFSSAMLNDLALWLSPVALGIVFSYSLTKRFTSYSHVALGFALACAPVGAWVAVREEISLLSLVLGAAVVFWLTGFDIIYSCLDVDHDRENDLHSIPQKFGVERALNIAKGSHYMTVVFLLAVVALSPLLGAVYLGGVVLVAGLLWFEHSLVNSQDLSKVNVAFFNVNGGISVLLMLAVMVDCVWN